MLSLKFLFYFRYLSKYNLEINLRLKSCRLAAVGVLLQPLDNLLVVLVHPCNVGLCSLNDLPDRATFAATLSFQLDIRKLLKRIELTAVGDLLCSKLDHRVECADRCFQSKATQEILN